MPIADKILAKFAKLKGKSLSLASRATLICSVITGSFVHSFMVYKWLVSLIQMVTKKIINFLWTGSCEESKLVRVARNRCCKPYALGGLGLKDLALLNDSLLWKLTWKLITLKNFAFTFLPERDILHLVFMARVQWSDLPVEILPIIFQKLKDPCDAYRCVLVCVSWKSIVTTILPPILLLSNVGKDKTGYFHFKASLNKQSCSLFNTQTNETHEIFLPEVENCWFSSSSFGWLLTISFEPPDEFHLLNPFTRDRIQLPSAKQFSRPYDLRVITSTTPLNRTCLVLAISHFKGVLAFCRPGDKYWTFFEDCRRCLEDVTFYNGEFNAVNSFGHLFHLHCHTPATQKVLRYGRLTSCSLGNIITWWSWMANFYWLLTALPLNTLQNMVELGGDWRYGMYRQ
ncbi:hypothetical protein Ddye_027544 [Dipteronia dyeriana]|uniref:F-box domain-containing protein n=1 Tax=Dipteronia dyeriana TaxID=168575 RepID=A0AAD9WQ98_9ROSI|nr:hypothetical protein Ddye_027544 [Dipteronia dyeriana]